MRAALLLMLLIPSASILKAQSATGEVLGTITDKSGGGVPGASVKLINQGTQVAGQVQTQPSGSSLFIGVRPGTYTLTGEMPGFKTAQVPAFNLSVNQTLTQNFTLVVGTLGETITVSSEAPLLQQASAELGTVISEQAVHELPLNGRNSLS